MPLPSYVLITPARNEGLYIGKVIESVVGQTVKPIRWFVVSDGSTDETDHLVLKAREENPWITLVRMPKDKPRSFSSKAFCISEAYEKAGNLSFDVVGNVDADLSFGEDVFEYLLRQFHNDPELGVAGVPFVEEDLDSYGHRFANLNHVSGACQLFRRECYEEIGGYVAIPGGGIDWIAVTSARMKGWRTRTFTDRTVFHHRKIGSAESSVYKSRFHYGRKDYFLGGHPLWEVYRSLYQMSVKPYVIGGALIMLGFIWEAMTGSGRKVPEELVRFHQKEQMERLRNLWAAGLPFGRKERG